MKTPREILLHRHAAAAPKLDAIRHAVVGGLKNEETKEQSGPHFFVTLFLGCPKKLWLELVWPNRRAWAGMVTIWLALAVFNLTNAPRGQIVTAKAKMPPATVRVAFQEQQQLLTEVIGQAPPALPAEPPRRPDTRPRSEKRATVMLG